MPLYLIYYHKADATLHTLALLRQNGVRCEFVCVIIHFARRISRAQGRKSPRARRGDAPAVHEALLTEILK